MIDCVPTPGTVPSFAGATLVVACASHANVGQLAVDLLACTLQLPRAAVLLSPHLLPCCGNDALACAPRGALCTSLEAHARPGLALLQQRAPTLPGAQRAFAAELADWAHKAGFAQVLLLAGLDPQLATGTQLGAAPLRHSSPPASPSPAWPVPEGWLALEGDVSLKSRVPPFSLVQALAARGVPALALCLFASDGDNCAHAALLADSAAQLLLLARPDGGWRAPACWATALFGSVPEDDEDYS